MSRGHTFNETLAFQLYHERKSDGDIAQIVGVKRGAIYRWRQKYNLQPNFDRVGNDQSCHYSEVLTREESVKMKRFLSDLLWVGKTAIRAGVKPDIGKFMLAWMGLPITEEEKRQRQRMHQMDYEKRRKESNHGKSR